MNPSQKENDPPGRSRVLYVATKKRGTVGEMGARTATRLVCFARCGGLPPLLSQLEPADEVCCGQSMFTAFRNLLPIYHDTRRFLHVSRCKIPDFSLIHLFFSFSSRP